MKIRSRLALAGFAAGLLWLGLGWPQAPRAAANAARELGQVAWQRDFDAALGEARASGRPALVLFQEVPGCATCVGFGEGALSHPLLVEAAETAFVPIAVLNNRPGADRELLERFGEPAWNNPVVRFLDGEGRDLIPRRAGIYTENGLARRMGDALSAAGRPAPDYLGWLDGDARVPVGRASFATHCFWEGEVCLGSEPGVRSTRASWHEGREVVEVWFDPQQIDYAALLERAKWRGCAHEVVAHDETQLALAERVFGDAATLSRTPPRPAPASDQKRHLRRSALRDLPLTRFQQTRVNAALATGADPTPWLSPRQRLGIAQR